MKQIIAMGGFSLEPERQALERYILAQTGKSRPSVCFFPHATADPVNYTLRFYESAAHLDCRPSHLSLFSPPTADLESFLLEKDVIYVGGGNTKSMLALWREWGIVDILRKAWERGIVLAGVSAGAICWFEQGLTDSIPGPYTALRCTGFLAGSCSPHYDGEVERRPRYHALMLRDEILPGYGVEDGAALHFVNGDLRSVVSSRPNAKAYRVEKAAGDISEQPLEALYVD
jgi:peptidase E